MGLRRNRGTKLLYRNYSVPYTAGAVTLRSSLCVVEPLMVVAVYGVVATAS